MGTSEEPCRLGPLLSTPVVLAPTSPHLSPTFSCINNQTSYFIEMDTLLVCVWHTHEEVLVHIRVHACGDQRLTLSSSAVFHLMYGAESLTPAQSSSVKQSSYPACSGDALSAPCELESQVCYHICPSSCSRDSCLAPCELGSQVCYHICPMVTGCWESELQSPITFHK